MRNCLLLCLLGVLMTLPASALPDDPFGGQGETEPAGSFDSPFRSEVLAAPDSVDVGTVFEARFLLRVPVDHYVYADQCSLEILANPGLEIVSQQSPPSETKLDPFLEEEVQVHKHDAEFVARLRLGWSTTIRAVLHSQGCSTKFCYFPQSDTLSFAVEVQGEVPVDFAATPGTAASPSAESRVHAAAERGLLWLLVLAFGAGVATSFTPCVYPMIPITISIIGARSAGRRSKGFSLSLLYVLGIALTYSILGTTAALTGSLFGSVLQNTWVLVGVALVFAVMGMSMFGAFELQVPSAFAGRMNRVQGSGYPGAFLLGLVAGIVASPCIGPVLVAMLAYVAASGSALLGFSLFFTFALGLGVLFIVLGTFTGMLANLPKSGGWMTRVKIGFGLLFLGLALYYVHPILPHGRALWAVGAGLLALGVGFGALRAIQETEPASRRWRKATGRALLVAGLYAAAVPFWAEHSAKAVAGPAWLTSEAEGMQRAAREGKPMLVDFSAAWCGACKELEHFTFSDPRVIDAAARFVPVRIDATTRTPEVANLMQKYGIRGLPWVAFVTPEGDILHDLTVTGFIDADAMLARMARAVPGGLASNAGGS